MGTQSNCVECNGCKKKYRVRYGMGNNFPQKASFICEGCSAIITARINSNDAILEFEGATFLPGVIGFGDDAYLVVNIHPELPIDKEQANNPSHFTTIPNLSRLINSGYDYLAFQELQNNWKHFPILWKGIENKLRTMAYKSEDEFQTIYSIEINDFLDEFINWSNFYLEGHWVDKFDPMNQFVNQSVKSDPSIIAYFKDNSEIWYERIYEFCSCYMKVRENFDSTILFQKRTIPLPDNQGVSISWDEIKHVYGDLYEFVGDFFILPTVANNVAVGRQFDEFNSEGFNLAKYENTDKANRGENFKDIEELKVLLESYLPWLRNGTHHKKCKYYPYNNQIELGMGRRGTNRTRVDLIDYVKHTNELFAVGVALAQQIFRLMA